MDEMNNSPVEKYDLKKFIELPAFYIGDKKNVEWNDMIKIACNLKRFWAINSVLDKTIADETGDSLMFFLALFNEELYRAIEWSCDSDIYGLPDEDYEYDDMAWTIQNALDNIENKYAEYFYARSGIEQSEIMAMNDAEIREFINDYELFNQIHDSQKKKTIEWDIPSERIRKYGIIAKNINAEGYRKLQEYAGIR